MGAQYLYVKLRGRNLVEAVHRRGVSNAFHYKYMDFVTIMLFTEQVFIHVYFPFNSFLFLRLLLFQIKSQTGVAY